MSREERKLRKHLEEKAKREFRKARKFTGKRPAGSRSQSAGLVVETGPGFCDVMSDGQRLRCRSIPGVAVGDQVLYSLDRRRVEDILPRRTVLSRADPQNPRIERVLAANVDLVVIVVAIENPPLRVGLIDRYLIAIAKSGAEPLICVNKVDLAEGAADRGTLRPYQDLGIPVVFCSAVTGEGLDELSTRLAGKTCVFSGHSGVGKSSLLNALAPGLDLSTNTVSEANKKGRHTTTGSIMLGILNGAMVIDTPGIREFGLWDVGAGDLHAYFPEFDSVRCSFSDCTHTHEPDCGVKAAVDRGDVSRERYLSYFRIMNASES